VSSYIHGTSPEEQRRLALLNGIVNAGSLRELAIAGGERILEFGSGLGQLARLMSRAAGSTGRVVGIEFSAEQIAGAEALASAAGEQGLVEFRRGDAADPPLEEGEWGSFDLSHARFLLEHVTDPQAVVRAMVGAVRPGGRVVLEDDDHDVLRLWPEPDAVLDVWNAYVLSYRRIGCDPLIGRKLVSLLHGAGAVPVRATWIYFGACPGDPVFPALVGNLAGILAGAREAILATGGVSASELECALTSLRTWAARPDASFGYAIAWAEGRRPQ
jgi:SAM-dependent methyltransferase